VYGVVCREEVVNSLAAPAEGRILIVDDMRAARATLDAQLHREGYVVAQCESGEEALEVVTQWRPDVVLLDVMMPGMDGIETCRRLRTDPANADLSIIMVTALDDAVSRGRCLEAGADDFVTKPVDRWELRARVHSQVRLAGRRKLEQEREWMRWVLERAPDGYVMLDAQDIISYANQRARQLLQLPAGELEPTLFLDTARAGYFLQPERPWARWGDAVDTGEPCFLVRPADDGGAALWLEVSRHESGTAGLRMVRLNDVTHAVERQNRQWEFREIVSHKLRTPLNGILGPLELLAMSVDDLPNDDLRQWVAVARESASRLSDAVRGVVASADERADAHGALVLGDLAAMAHDIAVDVAVTKLVVAVAPDVATQSIPMGEASVRAVLREALRNAWKFHPQFDPSVSVTARATESGWVSIEVRDDGVRLSPAEVERVFEPYFQVDPFRTGEVPGMGLGLAMIERRVWACGGRVRLENHGEGPGVALILEFPLGTRHLGTPTDNLSAARDVSPRS
jgi:CheY-like chemotaxis protein